MPGVSGAGAGRYNGPTFPRKRLQEIRGLSSGSWICALPAAGFPGAVFVVPYPVAPVSSSVTFVGVQQVTKFNGRFQEFTAEIGLDSNDPTTGSIVGVVRVSSV